MEITAQVIADSRTVTSRVTTLELQYPRYIHSQLKTHRVFSSNSASSRAIPLERMIELVSNDPIIPIWTKNQSGMQGEIADADTARRASNIWKDALQDMVYHVKLLGTLGIHKQDANRLLEPFMPIKTVLTGTAEGFAHFFKLRISDAAQPEIKELAERMKQAIDGSTPAYFEHGQYHCPYYGLSKDPEVVLASIARCAQVSYRKEDASPETVNRVVTRLISGNAIHASPFEHIVTPHTIGVAKGNLNGFCQLRHWVEYLHESNVLHDCGQLRKYLQDFAESD